MVSFSCEACGDILTKKKLDPHRNKCRGASFTCIDCMFHFQGTDYRSHTSCMTEAEKYEGAKARVKPTKVQRKENNNSKQPAKEAVNGGHRAPYVEDGSDGDNLKDGIPSSSAPKSPAFDAEQHRADAVDANDKIINVFDYLVPEKTPNASKVSLPGLSQPMQMVDHAPSVFEPSRTLARLDTGTEDEDKHYDVPYEENGFSYGAGPIPPSTHLTHAANSSTEFMTPAPKRKKKDRIRTGQSEPSGNGPASGLASDKKRKRGATEDHDMADATSDTPMVDAPSSIQSQSGMQVLNHSGLTGGLDRMLRSPSPGNESDGARGRYQDPSSPIKRTRRNGKETNGDTGLGISLKNRAGRFVSSMFGGSAVSGSSGSSNDPLSKAVIRCHSPSSEDRGQQLDKRVLHKPKHKSNDRADVDRPSHRLKQIEYRRGADRSRSRSPHGDNGGQIIVYRKHTNPSELQREMAAHFLSLVTKGPESSRGLSVNKTLKRFHRSSTDGHDNERGRQHDQTERSEDEKNLWRTLRLRRNERGEVVVFF